MPDLSALLSDPYLVDPRLTDPVLTDPLVPDPRLTDPKQATVSPADDRRQTARAEPRWKRSDDDILPAARSRRWRASGPRRRRARSPES